MIKVKDGYAKLIGTTYSGSASRVLLSNGGDHVLGNASGNIPLNNGTVSTNLNADMLDGLHIHTGRNNEVNKVVRTDGSGYILAGWINTTSGDMGTTAATRIYCSNDGYIRYKTPANFFSVLTNSSNLLSITVGDQNRKVTVAYATNAGSASNADTVDSLHSYAFKKTWEAHAGKTYIGWVTIAKWTISTASHFSPRPFMLSIHRAYNSPASESYTFAITFGWDTAHIVQVSGNAKNRIIEKLRIAKCSDNLTYRLEMYVNTSYNTYDNGCTCVAYGYYDSNFSATPVCELTANVASTLAEVTTASNYIVGNLSGTATNATNVYVNLHTSNNTEYPLVWSNLNNTNSALSNQLYKSYSHLTYNPNGKRITAGLYRATTGHFSSDTTLYVNSASASSIIFRIGGAEKARFALPNGYLGILTSSPSYPLHVSGDSYATGWSRAGSGFYVEGKGVHYMSNNANGLGQIYLTSNEFNWSASGAALYFNYRASANGTTVTSYTWNAGSSGSYASHTLGALTSRGDLTLYGLTQTCNKANNAGYMNSALLIREYNFGGSQSDTWAIAPRLSWHWSGRVLTLIGLASGGDLYLSKNNFTNAYLLLHLGNSSISDYNVKIGGTTKLFVRDWGHGAANMNAVARGGRSSMGMADLSTPSGGTATAVNPNGGTSWHHFINIAYTDGGAGSNSWITQIANKAGTTDLWVRSRSGGTISDTANWTAGWTRILTGTNYSSVLDRRYYTESEADSRFVNVTGDTMTGNLTMSTGTAIHLWDDSASASHRLTLRNASDIGRIYNYTGSAYGAMYLGHDGTNAIVVTSGLNVGIGTGSPSQKLHVNGNAIATNFGVNSTAGSGQGISLYGGSGYVSTYGIAFVTTGNWGTHGYVTGDWATYFTMSNTENRGWVFKRSGSGNVFSIDCDGHAYANGLVNASRFNSRVATGTQPYACTSTTCNTNLNADLLDGVHASGLFTNLSNSGNNISITIGGTNKTLTPAYASSAGNADTLDSYHRKGLYSSIPAWINANGYTVTVTVSGSANTYYPVVISTPTDKEFPGYISVWKNLGSTTASYSGNHSNGTSSMWLLYEVRNWYWDGNGGYLKCWYYSMPYATLCAKAEAAGSGVGKLVVYLRGGGTLYKVSSTYGATATVYTASTNIGSSSSPVNVAPTTSIGNRGRLSTVYLGYGDISGSSGSVRDAGNSTAITLKYSSGGFTSNPSYLAAWNGYQITYVAPSYVTVGGATLASTVTVNSSDANSTYRMVWHSGNSLYSTGGIYCNPSTDYLYAKSMNASDWFRSSGNTGWYNPTNNCHVYPNAATTYGGLMLRGEKGGYTGFILGTSTNYMNLMDNGTDKGLFQEGKLWILYYNRSNNGVGIRTSTITKNFNVSGLSYLSSNTWIGTTSGSEMLNVGGWVGTVGSTGWYSITHGGGWYMTDTTYVRTYASKAVHTANNTYYAFNSAGGFYSSWNNSYTINATNTLTTTYGTFNKPNMTVSLNTVQPILVWSNQVSSYGYATRYSISSIRPTNGAWGRLRLAVGNNDAGSSIGAYLDINGNGQINTGSKIYAPGFVHTSVSSNSYVLLAGGSYKAESSLSVNYATSAGSASSSGYIWAGGVSNLNSPTTWSSDGSRLVYDIYSGSASNKPVSVDNANGLVTFFKSKHGTSNQYVSLFAFPDHNRFYFRYAAAGSWGSWKTVAFTSDIPSVGNGTVTIKQAGTTKGSFTMNQSGNTTIELTDNNTTYSFAPKGSATQGIYLSGTNTFAAMTYSLKATVNSGTSSKLAYYSGANAISASTNTVGSNLTPVYLNGGAITACNIGPWESSSSVYCYGVGAGFYLYSMRFRLGSYYLVRIYAEVPHTAYSDKDGGDAFYTSSSKKTKSQLPSGYRPAYGVSYAPWCGASGNENNRGFSFNIDSSGYIYYLGHGDMPTAMGGTTVHVLLLYIV